MAKGDREETDVNENPEDFIGGDKIRVKESQQLPVFREVLKIVV